MPAIVDALKTSLTTSGTDAKGQPVPVLQRYAPAAVLAAGFIVMLATFFGYVPLNPQAAAMGQALTAAAAFYIRHMSD